MVRGQKQVHVAGVGQGLEPWARHVGASDPNFHPSIRRSD